MTGEVKKETADEQTEEDKKEEPATKQQLGLRTDIYAKKLAAMKVSLRMGLVFQYAAAPLKGYYLVIVELYVNALYQLRLP